MYCTGLDLQVKFSKSLCFALLSQPGVFHIFPLTIWDINIRYWSCNVNVLRMLPQVWNILFLVAFYNKHWEQSRIRCQKMSLREKVRFFHTKGIALYFAKALSIDVWKSRLFRASSNSVQLYSTTFTEARNSVAQLAELQMMHSNPRFNRKWQL